MPTAISPPWSRQRAPRIGVVAGRYLDGLYGRLYGGARPSDDEHLNLQRTLMRCLDGDGDRAACQTTARQLVEHRRFADHHRDALTSIGR